MFSRMTSRIANFYREIELQLRILFHRGGRRELKIYRLERNHGMSILWAPSKGRWVRARALHWGQKYVRVQFVDGAEKTGKRSPLSIRPRDPRKRGEDIPWTDARYSGNSVVPYPENAQYGMSILSTIYREFYRLTHRGPTSAEFASALDAHLTALEGG